jgi:hypothetical protein
MIPRSLPGSCPGYVAEQASWWTLLTIVQQYKDPTYRQPRMLSCPNDGEPFRQGPNGEWFCKFDGYRPGSVAEPYDLTGVGP